MRTRLERLKRHHEELSLALFNGTSLDDARAEIARRRSAARARAIAAVKAPTPAVTVPAEQPRERAQFWWERD
jgi:hypothetical protein